MRARKLSTLLVTGGLMLGMAAAPATADPKKGEIIPVDCDNGHSYVFAVNGDGAFTPAHNTASTQTFVPVSFGEFTFTVTDAQGNIVDQGSEPRIDKGKGNAAKGKKTLITCEFSFGGTEDGLTFAGSGTVTGFLTPNRG